MTDDRNPDKKFESSMLFVYPQGHSYMVNDGNIVFFSKTIPPVYYYLPNVVCKCFVKLFQTI